MGSRKSKKQTIGYWYHLAVQMAVAHAPVDYISQLVFGERTAWIGKVSDGNIHIDEKNLFGGEKREGGVAGIVSVHSGHENQETNAYVKAMRGRTSAQRGLLTLVFGHAGNGAASGQLGAINFNSSVMSPTVEDRLGFRPKGILSSPNHEMSKEQAYTYISNFYPQGVRTYYDDKKNSEIDPLEEQKKIYGNYKAVALMYAYRAFVLGNLIRNPQHRFSADVFFSVQMREGKVDLKHTQPFTWAAMNPYFKPVWVRVTNILSGWRGGVWYHEKAIISGSYAATTKGNVQCDDMNPAHIIYKVLTNTDWGMGYNPHDIDDASFRKAADKLYEERFGLSVMWEQEESIEDFIGSILDCIDGALRINVITGKFELILIRSDYNVNDLPVLNEDNIVELVKFERAAWGDSPNEIVLTYSDRNEDKAVVTVQNLAAIEIQGAVISSTQTYHQIHEPDLAARVAARELQVLSTPLAKIEISVNRIAFTLQSGDLFNLNWEALGIVNLACRVLSVTRGTFDDGVITIEAVEDVFGMPQQSYITHQPIEYDAIAQTIPTAVAEARIWEAPYYDVVYNMGEQTMRNFDVTNGNAFVRYFADQPMNLSNNFDVYASNTGQGRNDFVNLMKSQSYTPNFTLADNIDRTQTIFATSNIENLPRPIEQGSYIIIDNECMGIVRIDEDMGIIEVTRGTLDTIPETHYMGAKGWITHPHDAPDETYYAEGEVIYFRPLTNSTRGTLPFENSNQFETVLVGRAFRPFPVAGVSLNSQYFPSVLKNKDYLTINWNARNRKQSTPTQHWFYGSVNAEEGVKYNIRVIDNATQKVVAEYADYEQTYLSIQPPMQKAKFTIPVVQSLVYHIDFETTKDGKFLLKNDNKLEAKLYKDFTESQNLNEALQEGAFSDTWAFDVGTQYGIELPFVANKLNALSFTVGFRMFAGGAATSSILKMLNQNGANFLDVWIANYGSELYVHIGDNYPNNSQTSTAITPQTWHDVIVRFDNVAGTISIWLNGESVHSHRIGTWNRSSAGFQVVPTSGSVMLGKAPTTPHSDTIKLDDFFMYNVALSDTQIQALFGVMITRKWQESLSIEMETVRDNIKSWQTFRHSWQTEN